MKSVHKILAAFLAVVVSSACDQVKTGSVVLQGEIEGNPEEVIVVSYLPGERIQYYYPEVRDGSFEFSLDDVKGFADLIVSVGGVEFGARINALDTLKMNFVVNRYLEDVTVSYDGDTEKESRLWTDFYEAYLHWGNYNLAPDRDPDITYGECIALLDKNDSLFRAKYKADFNEYYEHRAVLAHDLLKAILIEQVEYENGNDPYDRADYVAMLEKVDPNDQDQVTFPVIYRWKNYVERGFEGNEIEKDVAFMKEYGSRITNADIKSMLANSMVIIGMRYINTDSLDIYEPFFSEIEKFTPDGAVLVEGCRARIDAALNSRSGNPVPDTVLSTPDGGEVKLSSLFGKVLYVDVWATWCGPCVKEGPYFREIAQKYKDDDRICFISISVDKEAEPWLAFLNEEKPFWPQFRLDGVNHDEFCNKVGIHSIPRFLLIDADGKFIAADCARPSSDEIEMILNKALEK